MDHRNRTALFDDWAGRYDPAANERFPFIGYANVLAAIAELANAEAGESMLDIGIGTGNLAALFAGRGCDVWGVDFSGGMLEQARRRLPAATLVQADLTAEEWPALLDRRFDRIVSAYTFHEFDDAAKLRLLRRLAGHHLNEGGTIIIGDIAFPTAEARETARNMWSALWDDDEYYWAADELIDAAESVGLALRFTRISPCAGVFAVDVR